jgi:hypothetical protein
MGESRGENRGYSKGKSRGENREEQREIGGRVVTMAWEMARTTKASQSSFAMPGL